MGRCLISLTTLSRLLLNLSLTSGACIFLQDCDAALKYLETKRNDPQTISILQNAHCGFEKKNGLSEAKVLCEKIPVFTKFPHDCIPFYNCPAAVQLISTKKNDPQVIELLRSMQCGDSEKKDTILCNNVTLKFRETKRQLLPKLGDCGLQMPITKINSGKTANIDEFRWIALIKYKNISGEVQYKCHGSLISRNYVITGAYCFYNINMNESLNKYLVVLGEYNIKTLTDCVTEGYDLDCTDPVQEFLINAVHVHVNFDPVDDVNDIALIRLNDTVTFSDFVKPICLPLKFEPLENREVLWTAGWGTEHETMSDVKLKARLFSLEKRDCKERINYIPHDTLLCAGSDNGTDICTSGPGGPLMAQRVIKGEYKTFLVGVVTFKVTCVSRAAVYTNVSRFIDWILDNMKE